MDSPQKEIQKKPLALLELFLDCQAMQSRLSHIYIYIYSSNHSPTEVPLGSHARAFHSDDMSATASPTVR